MTTKENDTAPKTQTEKKTSGMVTYVPGPGDDVETTWGGKRFVAGMPVKIDDPDMLERAAANPNFSVDGKDGKADMAKKAAETAKEEAAMNAGVIKAKGEALKARHKQETEALAAKQKAESDAQAAAEKSATAT